MHKLIIPGTLPDLNRIINLSKRNKYEYAREKKVYTESVAWHARVAKLPHMERIFLVFNWFCPDMKIDKDNICVGKKFILDGLIEANVIKNDGWKQIDGFVDKFFVDRKHPRIEVEIKEVS